MKSFIVLLLISPGDSFPSTSSHIYYYGLVFLIAVPKKKLKKEGSRKGKIPKGEGRKKNI